VQQKMYRVNRIHFIGIGGVGMCGVAEILVGEGYTVSGSDLSNSLAVKRLRALGVQVSIGHQADHISEADVVVITSAIADDNPELMAAKERNIPVIQRAAMLAEIMRFRFGVAIAGTHGKTTTTSLCASILTEGKLDPTFVIGGKLISADTNARLGKSNYLVAEADESDASFLHLTPMLAVVTNVDVDHMENYSGSFDLVKQAFLDFLHNMPFYGVAIMCCDDEGVQALLPRLSRSVLTYGFSPEAAVVLSAYRQEGASSEFTLTFEDRAPLRLTLNLPGRHNALNATAAILVALELGVQDEAILASLSSFQGVGRRFQQYGAITCGDKNVTFIDDYAHHPKELEVTIFALKEAYPDTRIVLVFQPHRYTRTLEQFDYFCQVLSEVDELILLDVYPAGEAYIEGGDSLSLAKNIRKRGNLDPLVVADEKQLYSALPHVLQHGDVLVTAGAGSIGRMAANLVKETALVRERNV
jgi:UDP-N-acetylmuramate--alanine ligase